MRGFFEFMGDNSLHVMLFMNYLQQATVSKIIMRKVVLEVTKPVHHHSEKSISILRRHLENLIQVLDGRCTPRLELGILCGPLACEIAKSIWEMPELGLPRQLHQELLSHTSRSIKECRKKKTPGPLCLITGTWSVGALVLHIVFRTDDSIGTAKKFSQCDGALVVVMNSQPDPSPTSEQTRLCRHEISAQRMAHLN